MKPEWVELYEEEAEYQGQIRETIRAAIGDFVRNSTVPISAGELGDAVYRAMEPYVSKALRVARDRGLFDAAQLVKHSIGFGMETAGPFAECVASFDREITDVTSAAPLLNYRNTLVIEIEKLREGKHNDRHE